MEINTKEQAKGSQTARAGFQNETDVIETFNAWETNTIAQAWLENIVRRLTSLKCTG